MQKLHLGAVPVTGWVAVNGNLENALVMSSREGEVITPGHVPLWLHEGAGEAFLEELQELRIEGTPVNGRLVRVVMFELVGVEGEEGE